MLLIYAPKQGELASQPGSHDSHRRENEGTRRMANGPRDYTVGVERKLYRVARGTCYHPDCMRPIMVDVHGMPICDVEIAHIRGAEPSAARYDPGMTDAQRASFANLILLCSAHHKLIDRIAPDDHPPELLQQWKAENEDDDLAVLAGGVLTQETLEAALEEIAGRLRPRREVTVELLCGVILPSGTGDVMTSPDLATLEATVAQNPGWHSFPRVLVTSIRNIGSAAVDVEAVDLYFPLAERGAAADRARSPEGRVTGQDTFPGQNPPLPHRVEDGSAMHWFTKFEHVEVLAAVGQQHGRTVPSIRSEVRLATGETVSSPPFDLALADDDAADQPAASD